MTTYDEFYKERSIKSRLNQNQLDYQDPYALTKSLVNQVNSIKKEEDKKQYFDLVERRIETLAKSEAVRIFENRKNNIRQIDKTDSNIGFRSTAPEVNYNNNLSFSDRESKTGFISRARTKDWQTILTFGSQEDMPKKIEDERNSGQIDKSKEPKFRGIMFQAQQRQMVEALMNRLGTTQLVTQQWDSKNPDSVSANILAPNSMVKNVATQINKDDTNGNKEVIMVGKAPGASFHPKVGYVKGWGDDASIYAFFGTQNWTPALDKNSTMESLIILDAKAAERHLGGDSRKKTKEDLADVLFGNSDENFARVLENEIKSSKKGKTEFRSYLARKFVEQEIGQEVIGLTDNLLQDSRNNTSDQYYSNIALARLREKRPATNATASGLSQNFTLYNHEILEEYNDVLEIAAKRSQKVNNQESQVGMVFLSLNRMDALLNKQDNNDPQFSKIKENLLKLAHLGKLRIITDRKNYSDKITNNKNLDTEFLSKLSNNGAIKFNPVMHHDKGMYITDEKGKGIYMAAQSANLTKSGFMMRDTELEKGSPVQVAGDDNNTEVMLRVKGGVFLEEHLQKEYGTKPDEKSQEYRRREREAYEGYIEDSGIAKHYSALLGTNNVLPITVRPDPNQPLYAGQQGYSTQRYSEINANSIRVNEFISKIDKINEQYGQKVLTYQKRYSPGERYSQDGVVRMREYNEVVGVRIRVNSTHGGVLNSRGLEVDLTVNQEGNIILSDVNKVISNTIILNQTTESMPIPGTDKVIEEGQTQILSSEETALSMLTTMAREVGYLNKEGLPSAIYKNLILESPKNANNSLAIVLKDLILKEVYKDNSDLVKDLYDNDADLSSILSGMDSQDLNTYINRAIDYASTYDINTGERITSESVLKIRREQVKFIFDDIRVLLNLKTNDKDASYLAISKELYGSAIPSEQTNLNLIHRKILEDTTKNKESVLGDFRSLIVASDPIYNKQYMREDAKKSTEIREKITQPFFAAHENERSQMQRNLPVYAITERTVEMKDDTSLYNKGVKMGLLDPAQISHSTYIGAGLTQRPLDAVGFKGQTNYGEVGVSSVVGDTEATTVKVVEMLSILEGVSGFGHSTLEKEVTQLIKIVNDIRAHSNAAPLTPEEEKNLIADIKKNKDTQYTAKFLDREGMNVPLFIIPYTKMEQITQRMKNVVGARPAKTVSNEVYQKALSLDQPLTQQDLDNIFTGNIRSSLPDRQWQVLEKLEERFRATHPQYSDPKTPLDYDEFIEFLREMDTEPLHENKGIVGPAKLKRVALHGGFNTMGDFGVMNEAFLQPYADVKREKLTFNLGSLDSTSEMITNLTKILSKGTKIIGGDGLYIQEERTPTQDNPNNFEWVKAGVFTDTGQIRLTDKQIRKLSPNELSLKAEPVTLTVGSDTKKYEGGVTIFTGDAVQIDTSSRGTLVFEQNQVTMSLPHSGSRNTGGGSLPKGPQMFVEEKLFNEIATALEFNKQELQVSNYTATEQITQLATLDQFKGFTFETGLALLTDPTFREQVTRDNLNERQKIKRGKDIAQSIAFLLLGDDQIRTSLIEFYNQQGQYSMANTISQLKGTDLGTTKTNALNIYAQGLAALNSTQENIEKDIIDGQLSQLKNQVKEALSSQDPIASNKALMNLALKSQQLFDIVTNNTNYSKTYTRKDNEPDVKTLEQNTNLVKSAGILAHVMYFNQRLFNEDGIHSKKSVGGLFQQGLPTGKQYITIRNNLKAGVSISEDERRRYDFVNYIAASTGMNLTETKNDEDIKRKVDTIKGAQDNDFIIDTLIDSSNSRTLVSAGKKDQVNLEFHYSIGMAKNHLQKFRKAKPLYTELSTIQEAYSTLVAAVGGGYHTAAMSQIGIRTIFNYIDTTTQEEREERKQKRLNNLENDYNSLQNLIRNIKNLDDTQRKQLEKHLSSEYIASLASLSDDDRNYLLVGFERKYNLEKKQIVYEENSDERKSQYALSREELDIRRVSKGYNQNVNPDFKRLIHTIIDKDSQYTANTRPPEVQTEMDKFVATLDEKRKDKSLSSDMYKDYLHGTLSAFQELYKIKTNLEADKSNLEHKLQTQSLTVVQQRETQKLLNKVNANINNVTKQIKSISQTQQIIVPNMQLEPMKGPNTEGQYRVQVSNYYDAKPTVGVLMGVDLLQNLSLVYGSHRDEAIISQYRLIEALEIAQPILQKIQDPNNYILSEDEAKAIIELQKAALESQTTLTNQHLTNETMRRALGDHESFSGAVGYALNSFALSPHEMVLGDRFTSAAEGFNLDKMIDRQINNLYSNLQQGTDDPKTLTNLQILENILSPLTPTTPQNDNSLDRSKNYINIIFGRKSENDMTKEEQGIKDQYNNYRKFIKNFFNNKKKEIINNNKLDRKQKDIKIKKLVEITKSKRSRLQQIGIKAYYYHRILGLKKEGEDGYGKELEKFIRILYSNKEDDKKIAESWDRQINLNLGGEASRTGAPAVTASLMGENVSTQRILSPEQMRLRVKQEKGKFIPSQKRSSTLMMVPSISTLIAGLGDYDGDSYQVRLSKANEVYKEVQAKQRQLLKARNKKLDAEREYNRQVGTEETREKNAFSTYVSTNYYFGKTFRSQLQDILQTSFKNTSGNKGELQQEIERLNSINNNFENSLIKIINNKENYLDTDYLELIEEQNIHKQQMLDVALKIFKDSDNSSIPDKTKQLYNIIEDTKEKEFDSEDKNLIFSIYQEISKYKDLLSDQNKPKKNDVLPIKQKVYEGKLAAEKLENLIRAREIENEVEEELIKVSESFKDQRINLEEGYNNQMKYLNNFVRNFTSLPDFAFKDIDVPTSLTYISQKYDDSGVQDADWLKQAERKIELFGRLFGSVRDEQGEETLSIEERQTTFNQVVEEFKNINNEEAKLAKARQLLRNLTDSSEVLSYYSDKDEEALKMASGELVEIMRLAENNNLDYKSVITTYYTKLGNYEQTLKGVQKSFKKVEGVVLNPFEFEAIQGAVGEGGSKLIGAAYNTLIPLMERSMFEQGILVALNISNQTEDIKNELITRGGTNQDGENLVDKLNNDKFKSAAQKRYFSTMSTLASFQQLVRDALKAKSGTDLNEAFRLTGFNDKIANLDSLKDQLVNDENKNDPQKINQIRKQIEQAEQDVEDSLYSALTRQTGAVVSQRDNDAAKFFLTKFAYNEQSINEEERQKRMQSLFSSDQLYDPNLTAFGILIELSNFTKMKDADTIYQQFDLERNQSFMSDTNTLGAEDYIASQLSEAVQRTEAAYKATTLTGEGKELFLNQAFKWHEENSIRDYNNLTQQEKNFKDLIDTYHKAINEGKDEVDKGKMKDLLLQELIYTNIREDNKTAGAMNMETILMLREMQQAQNMLSDDESEFSASRKAIANVQLRQMMRGKNLNTTDAVNFASWNLQAIDSLLETMGYTQEQINELSTDDKSKVQAKIAKISPTGAFNNLGDLTENQQQALVGLIAGLYDTKDKKYSQSLAQSTEATGKVLQFVDNLNNPDISKEEKSFLSYQIEQFTTSSGQVDVKAFQEIKEIIGLNGDLDIQEHMQSQYQQHQQSFSSGTPIPSTPSSTSTSSTHALTPPAANAMDNFLQALGLSPQSYQNYVNNTNQGGGGPSGGNNTSNGVNPDGTPQGLLFRSGVLEGELFGAFGSIAAFSLLAADQPEDDRLPMMAFDSVQALAEIGSSRAKGKASWTRSIGGDMSKEADFKFKLASLRQSMEAQGAARGLVQGVSQQMVSRGFNSLAQMGVQRMMPVRSNAKGLTAIAGAATEVLGSVMSLSVSRALTRHKTNVGTSVNDFVSGFLINYVESVWKMVEEMQLALLNSQAEVLDSSYNQNWDFDTDGHISDFNWDIETGMIVIDSNDTPLSSAFDSAENQQYSQSVDQQTAAA